MIIMITDDELKCIIGKTENNVKNDVMEYLTNLNIYHWRNNTGRRGGVKYGLNGSADILGILPNGILLAIETKCKTKQNKDQIEFQRNIEINKGIYILAHSISDVMEYLSKLNYK